MRHTILALILLAATVPPVVALAAGDLSSPASSPTPAGVPAAPAAAPSPTPSIAERVKALEAARAELVQRCTTGIAQHDGAIAALKALGGEP